MVRNNEADCAKEKAVRVAIEKSVKVFMEMVLGDDAKRRWLWEEIK